MKLECIKDVIMNRTGKIELFKGKIYEGFNYRGGIHVKNNSGYRHEIKLLDSDKLDEFFNEHFIFCKEPNYFEEARKLLPKSNCLKRQYACVIVLNGHLVSRGWNESLQACTTCARKNFAHNFGSYNECGSVHAEVSALLGIELKNLRGAELYLVCNEDENPQPCPACKKLMDYCGVKLKSLGCD